MHACHDNIHILRTTLDDICVSFFAWICYFVNIFGCCFDRLKTETNSESVVEANLLLVAQYRGQAHTQPGVKKKKTNPKIQSFGVGKNKTHTVIHQNTHIHQPQRITNGHLTQAHLRKPRPPSRRHFLREIQHETLLSRTLKYQRPLVRNDLVLVRVKDCKIQPNIPCAKIGAFGPWRLPKRKSIRNDC